MEGSDGPGGAGVVLTSLVVGFRSISLANSDCEGSESWGAVLEFSAAGWGAGGPPEDPMRADVRDRKVLGH